MVDTLSTLLVSDLKFEKWIWIGSYQIGELLNKWWILFVFN